MRGSNPCRVDVVLRLRKARRRSGLTQRDAGRLSGVGEKTISSFETGARTDSMKISQLLGLLGVYGVTPAEFFGRSFRNEIEDGADLPNDNSLPASRTTSIKSHEIRKLHDRFKRGIDLSRAEISLMFDYVNHLEREAEVFDWQGYHEANGWLRSPPGSRRIR